jgi:uncharacterized protein with PQ loop repeat
MTTKINEKTNIKNERIGLIAVSLSVISFLPLLYHVTKNRTTLSITYCWLILGIIAQCFWFYYAFSNMITPMLLTSSFYIISYIYLSSWKYYLEG